MDPKITNLTSTRFQGRRFTRQQLAEIQATVKKFSTLSLRELAHTICEHLNWFTPTGTDKIHTCLNALEEMEAHGIITLPAKKVKHKKAVQKAIQRTDLTSESTPIDCALEDIMPIRLQVVTEKDQADQWNEFIDRHHYLGYRRPMGSYLRYYILDRDGRKLGCLFFSFATLRLACRDQWIGWTATQRKKHLNLVVNNNRFLIFPWINVKHLASKALSLAVRQIADDWEQHHGYRPVLLETFVDPRKYKGTCYKAANWQNIGKTVGKGTEKTVQKDVYIYPLKSDARAALVDEKKSPSKKAQPFKTANLASDSHISLWQKIITIVAEAADEFDRTWQKRRRAINSLLLVIFIFRLTLSKNKQGYGTTIAELWDYCRKMNIPLPQPKPVTAAAFCNARAKLDENIFKTINTKVIRTYEAEQDDYLWKNHRLFAVDGTKINLPKQLLACGYQTPTKTAYYPQGLVSCLYQLKSKVPFDFDLSSHRDERKMALNHLDVLNRDDIVVYDRGYLSYHMLYSHYKKNIHAVFRLSSSTFKVINDFIASADTERVVVIEANINRRHEILRQHPGVEFIPLTLRLIKYVVSGTTFIIGTTLLDSQRYRTEEFPDIYHARWGIEELYKISKTLIDVEDFHGQTERGVRQELFAHFLLITFGRIFTNQTDDALMLNKKSGRSEKIKANVKNCLITLARNLEALFLQQAQNIKETIITVINLVSTCRQKERHNRSYERKSHKPPKKWTLNGNKRKIKLATAA